MNRPGSTMLRDAVRYRWITFLAVAAGLALAVLALMMTTPSRYDALSIVGLTPSPQAPAAADVLRLSASQFAEAATARDSLRNAEDEAGVPPGTLQPGQVQAELVPDTALVQLVVSADDPQESADLATALAVTVVSNADADLFEAEVVREAQVPTSPAAPARTLYLVAGVLAGIGMGLCAVGLLETWRPKVRNAAHLELLLGVPTVADLAPQSSHDPPESQMRLAQLRLSRSLTRAAGNARESARTTGVAVLGAGAATHATLNWVSEGLAAALISSGHPAQLIDPYADGPPETTRRNPEATTLVLPVEHASRNAQGLAAAQTVGRAVVVVSQHEPAQMVEQFRHDLEAIGLEVVAGVMVCGEAPSTDVEPPVNARTRGALPQESSSS